MIEKQLPGLSRYRFRSDGEVISYQGVEPRPLIGGLDKDGYRKFVLIDDMGGRRYVRRASLICAAFHGPRPKGREVRHLDGVRQNDAPSNVVWSTHKENCGDKLGHGTAQRGVVNGNAKITEEQARMVKGLLRNGLTARETATISGVTRANVYNIKYGKTWFWL